MAKQRHKQKIPLRIRLLFLTRNWVWLFWILLLPVVWVLLPLERFSNPISGYIAAETENIGPFETVRIRALHVSVGQHIEPGDILIEVEGFAEQKEKLDALDYTVKSLNVQQNAQQQEQSIFSLELRTKQILEETRVDIAAKEMEQTRDRAMLEGLRKELELLEPMVEKGLISDMELTRIRPQITALTQTLAGYPALINSLNARMASARAELRQIERYKEAQKSSFSGIHGDTLTAIGETVSDLEHGRVSYIYAKTKGVVSRIQYNVGDVVESGVPIIRTTSLSSIKVMGLLRPYQVEFVREGMTLTVVPPYRTIYKRFLAEIVSIEPEILDLKDPFTPISSNPLLTRGQRITLVLKDENHDLIPGENVTIFLPPPTFRQKIDQLISQIQWKIDEKKTVWK